ncbi:MAG: radical SAM protein [Candidatus Thermoplasmatota archaeon]|nr:radical SAM protein [Candidatus Thermoplasmatota archaeon]
MVASEEHYKGFEQGPIRPPSEAKSLLIRVTRNCPWNRCTFCPLYKNSKFSIRDVKHVKRDIETIAKFIERLNEIKEENDKITPHQIREEFNSLDPKDVYAFETAYHWFINGMNSIFLQDSNSLVVKPENLVEILGYIKEKFPRVKRITSYARSSTVVRISEDNLAEIANAGLNRIHIGMESGADVVLKNVKKGATKQTHVEAGTMVKIAGIELSEYIMPGLGGKKFSKIHALESAGAISKINPDFIRLRPLAIPHQIPLYNDYIGGKFLKCTDLMMVKELKMFIKNLQGISSMLQSDHILNLFADLEGKFPEDKQKMLNILNSFLQLRPKQRGLYQVGRRLGIFSTLKDLENPYLLSQVKNYYDKFKLNRKNINELTDSLMQRFI